MVDRESRDVDPKSKRPPSSFETITVVVVFGFFFAYRTWVFGYRSWFALLETDATIQPQEMAQQKQMLPVYAFMLLAAVLLVIVRRWRNRAVPRQSAATGEAGPDATKRSKAARKAEAWRRFWARHLDYLIAIGLVLTVLPVIPPGLAEWLERETGPARFAFPVLYAALWVVPEALLIHWLGTTPGKWVLGIRIETKNGENPSLKSSLRRSLGAWCFGAAFNTPAALLSMSRAQADLEKSGRCRWDGELVLMQGRLRLLPAANVAMLIAVVGFIGLIAYQQSDEAAEFARAEVAEVSKLAVQLCEERGVALATPPPPTNFKLADGEISRNSLKLTKGGLVVVTGGCDNDCEDLDIAVTDPAGEAVVFDRAADSRPMVDFEPLLTGEYAVIISMNSCKIEPCTAGYSVLRSDTPLPPEPPQIAGTGTGFAVDSDGAILTANHVIDGATKILVVFRDGTRVPAVVERRSQANDLALLRVNIRTDSYLPIADPDSVVLGEPIFVLGFPVPDDLGEEVKFTDGSVTALSGLNGDAGKLQFSAPIQPGNSGGPVVDSEGQVVAIVTSFYIGDERAQLVNWATKSSIAAALVGSRPDESWKAADRQAAIERALGATVFVIVE